MGALGRGVGGRVGLGKVATPDPQALHRPAPVYSCVLALFGVHLAYGAARPKRTCSANESGGPQQVEGSGIPNSFGPPSKPRNPESRTCSGHSARQGTRNPELVRATQQAEEPGIPNSFGPPSKLRNLESRNRSGHPASRGTWNLEIVRATRQAEEPGIPNLFGPPSKPRNPESQTRSGRSAT